jgi:hypothetical protein
MFEIARLRSESLNTLEVGYHVSGLNKVDICMPTSSFPLATMLKANSGLHPSNWGMDLYVHGFCGGRCLSVDPEGLSITFITT